MYNITVYNLLFLTLLFCQLIAITYESNKNLPLNIKMVLLSIGVSCSEKPITETQ